MTVIEILTKTSEYFKSRGVDSPRLTSELLLSDLLSCKRLDLYLNYDKPLTETETDAFREYVKRRGAREPLQYIIGKASFMDFDVSVRPGCLIPRPETAAILETLSSEKELFSELAPKTILDIGTGSGIIAIAAAKLFPDAKITAIDKSDKALEIAKANGASAGTSKIEFILSDLFTELVNRKFDLILSNPPYIPSAELSGLQKEVSLYEPAMALDGGIDGLDFYRAIIGQAASFLMPNGRIYFEHGDGQSDAIEKIAAYNKFKTISKIKDLAGKLRVIVLEK
ncbi:MAG: peptide chain release factor N(5)-glutamine methyltransferase [Fibrobacteres bacterium]|nr:peptide chain release factor N(5)-glutamine methyltransferase [Fibrobacterota bacterium]